MALTIGFAIIRDPTIAQISIDFSCFFVAEWGIQIVGVAQSCSALELVALLSAITNSTVESSSRAAFRKTQRWIWGFLSVICLAIVIVPLTYIIRSTIIFN